MIVIPYLSMCSILFRFFSAFFRLLALASKRGPEVAHWRARVALRRDLTRTVSNNCVHTIDRVRRASVHGIASLPYSGYFSGGKTFVVFVIERRTTDHETVPHSTGVCFSIRRPRKVFHELAQNSLLAKILPPEKYPLYGN